MAYLKLFFEPLDHVRSAYFVRYGDEDIVKQSTYGSLSDVLLLVVLILFELFVNVNSMWSLPFLPVMIIMNFCLI